MHIPQIQLTAQGSGLYTVNMDGVAQTPEHVTTREADEHITNLKLANPNATLTYTQNLTVTASISYLEDPVPEPSTLVFLDDFNYVVDKTVGGAEAVFQQHGWSNAKTQQDTTRHPNGYIYTVDAIPGSVEAFPAGPRALCLEALPTTLGGQTDFYLAYGNGEDPASDNAVPANAWFRFWLYINHTTDQPSAMTFEKFIYACNGSYPCNDYHWMVSLETNSADPVWNEISGVNGDCFINNSAKPTTPSSVVNPASTNPGYEWRMGQTDISEHLVPNRWQEVTLHMDTSTVNGMWEAWIHPRGGVKVKVAEFISGQNGFQWNITNPSGHRTFRLPTTVGSTSGGPDNWMYMQKFRIASSEAGLA